MARLNPGGFAAGFESGFGLVQKAKKDKRDFELQQESLRQKALDREQDQLNKDRTFGLNERNIASQEALRKEQTKEIGARLNIAEKDLEIRQENLDFLKQKLPLELQELELKKQTAQSQTEIAQLNAEIKAKELEIKEIDQQIKLGDKDRIERKTDAEINANEALTREREAKSVKQENLNDIEIARKAEGVIREIIEGNLPLQSQIDDLAGTQYDLNKYLDPDQTAALEKVTKAWSKAADPNSGITIQSLVQEDEILDALDLVFHEQFNINLDKGVKGKHLAQILSLPSEMIKQYGVSGDQVLLEMLVTRDDGTLYVAPATVGRQNSATDPVQTVSVRTILDQISGQNVIRGMVKNLEGTGKLEKLQRMASSRVRAADEPAVRLRAQQDALDAWDKLKTTEREQLKLDGIETKAQYVMDRVNIAVSSSFSDPDTRFPGVNLAGLNSALEGGLNLALKRGLPADIDISTLTLDFKVELFNEALKIGRKAPKGEEQNAADRYVADTLLKTYRKN